MPTLSTFVFILAICGVVYVYRRAAEWDRLHGLDKCGTIDSTSKNRTGQAGAVNTDQALSQKRTRSADDL